MRSSCNVLKNPVMGQSHRLSVRLPENLKITPDASPPADLEMLQAEAQHILTEAEHQSEKIRLQAAQEGFEKGYSEGYRTGLIKASQEIEVMKMTFESQISEWMIQIESLMKQLSTDYEAHLVELAIRVSSIFIKNHSMPEHLKAHIQSMIQELAHAGKIICSLHPEDYEVLSVSHRMFQDLCPDSRLMFVKNFSMTPGTVRCETDAKMIEFDPGRQIEKLLSNVIRQCRLQQETLSYDSI